MVIKFAIVKKEEIKIFEAKLQTYEIYEYN